MYEVRLTLKKVTEDKDIKPALSALKKMMKVGYLRGDSF